jgi:hypothetical protein
VSVVGSALASGFKTAAPELHPVFDNPNTRTHAADWLTEQYDRAERKESRSVTMEVAITLFVAVELFLSILNFFHVSWPVGPRRAAKGHQQPASHKGSNLNNRRSS